MRKNFLVLAIKAVCIFYLFQIFSVMLKDRSFINGLFSFFGRVGKKSAAENARSKW